MTRHRLHRGLYLITPDEDDGARLLAPARQLRGGARVRVVAEWPERGPKRSEATPSLPLSCKSTTRPLPAVTFEAVGFSEVVCVDNSHRYYDRDAGSSPAPGVAPPAPSGLGLGRALEASRRRADFRTRPRALPPARRTTIGGSRN